MDNDESVVGTITASSYSSISGDTSGTVTVTTAVTDCVVTSTEGSGLQPGDVLSFPLVTNPTITITITLGENDLQLGAGLNVLKATTVVLGLTLAPYETVACNFTQVQVQALDNGNNALVTGYFA